MYNSVEKKKTKHDETWTPFFIHNVVQPSAINLIAAQSSQCKGGSQFLGINNCALDCV